MRELADARSEARRLLSEQGERALLHLSDAMADAMRSGNNDAADRFERILVHAEHELDGKPIPRSRLALWRGAASAMTSAWPNS